MRPLARERIAAAVQSLAASRREWQASEPIAFARSRFRLRAVLIGVAVSGLFFGLVVEARKQARALARWEARRYHRSEAERELRRAGRHEGRAAEARRLSAVGSSAADSFGLVKTSSGWAKRAAKEAADAKAARARAASHVKAAAE